MKAKQNEEYERIINDSPIDIELLTKAINDSRLEPTRNEVFAQVLTSYTCKICGYFGQNGDTNVPLICQDCARKLARSIVIDGSPILKK